MTDLQKLQNNNWYVNMKDYRIPQVQYYDEQMVIVNGVSYTRTEPTPIVIQEDENTIVVGGVKYQRMEDPKPQTLYDALCEKSGMYSSVCDTVVEIVEKWMPLEGCHELKSYDYSDGWNDHIKYLKENLK